VLVLGETGSGKELAARAIHQASQRRGEPFVAVNMATLPATLAAAELFGAVRGAYTGADRRRQGLFAQAHGGTLFLDEIGETPPEVQALLLRAVETHEIRPVGSEAVQKVDVRLISATDADLEAGIAAERFRAPLLYRLGGFELHLPPLRARRDDIARLLRHFLRRELAAVGEQRRLETAPGETPWLSAELVARLVAYDWPGNVRQLRNVTRQLVINSRGEERARLPEPVEMLLAAAPRLTPSDSDVPPRSPGKDTAAAPPPVRPKPSELTDADLVAVLRAHRFNLSATAAALRISRTSLYARIEKCPRLRKPAELDRDEIEASLGRAGGDVDAAAAGLEVSSLGLKRRLKELGLS
jgi:two-component system nitrogen regulation response regulator GlnG